MKDLLEILPKILGFLPEVIKYLKYIPIIMVLGGIGYGVYYFMQNAKDPYKCYNNQLFEQKSVLSNVYIFIGETCIEGNVPDNQTSEE
jgi:hypothetical protein